jgi:hypothetical protein
VAKVQIQGLNQRQRSLADILWMMNSRADVDRFIGALHPSMRPEAQTVVELMQLAIYDEIETIDPEITKIIDNLR